MTKQQSTVGNGDNPTASTMLKAAFTFCIVTLSLGANLPDNMVSRFGVDQPVIIGTLIAIVITWCVANRHVLLVVLVCALAMGTNMNQETAEYMNIDRDILLSALIVLVCMPLIAKAID